MLHIGLGMVFGYFILTFKPWDSFRPSFFMEPLDARGEAAKGC